MACGEPNRLAQGLVRQELRGLPTNGEQILYELSGELKKASKKYFGRKKKFPENELLRLQRLTASTLADRFKAFRIEEAPDILDLNQGYFWDISKDVHTSNRDDEADFFREDHIELRLMRHYMDRRRAFIDFFHCNLSVTFHALQRMIEREEVSDRPIAYLSEMMDEILAFTFLHLIATGKREPEVAIPLRHGYLVGMDMAFMSEFADQEGHNPLRMRIISDIHGFHVTTANNVRDFRTHDGKPVGLRISTYLSEQQLYEQQTRMFAALRAFRERHYESLMLLPRLTFLTGLSDEQISRDSAAHRADFSKMLTEYFEIVNSDDWKYSLSR